MMKKRFFILFICFIFLSATFFVSPKVALASTATSYLSPGSAADVVGVGTYTWQNPENATASDNAYAKFPTPPGGPHISHYLWANNFGFTIPAGATIDGVVCEIERYRGGPGGIYDNIVRLVKANGSLGTANRADTVTNWPIADAYAVYGGAADLWGDSWTAADINDSDFGFVLSANSVDFSIVNVDHMRIKVYYTVVAAPPDTPDVPVTDPDNPTVNPGGTTGSATTGTTTGGGTNTSDESANTANQTGLNSLTSKMGIQQLPDSMNGFVDYNGTKINSVFVTTILALLLIPAAINAAIGLSNFFPQMVYWLTQLLQIMGLRKKRKPWGVVFNSVTGGPVSLAMVRIFDREYNRLLESAVTDKEGRFGFLVRPGTFYLTVTKNSFTFPSQFKNSEFFDNVYLGGDLKIEAQTDQAVILNIPMDGQVKASWVFTFWTGMIRVNRVLQKIRLPLMVVGIIFALIMILATFGLIYILSIILYILLFILEIFQAKKLRPYGIVSEGGSPLNLAIVRIFNKRNGRLVATEVTDNQGRFKFLVDSGIYYLTVIKPGFLDFQSSTLLLSGENTVVANDIKLKKV